MNGKVKSSLNNPLRVRCILYGLTEGWSVNQSCLLVPVSHYVQQASNDMIGNKPNEFYSRPMKPFLNGNNAQSNGATDLLDLRVTFSRDRAFSLTPGVADLSRTDVRGRCSSVVLPMRKLILPGSL
ncbi:unnamed protein product [Protopolystoma xenopodis]|uniref:Uncharacterized protein n=1 Tax=Protopolystoma xenopodis TaxID=117903 RepID=A0A448WC22_9PLAT|nr:unnamed protein product [Protopolystoma xenopodis]